MNTQVVLKRPPHLSRTEAERTEQLEASEGYNCEEVAHDA